MFFDQVKGLTMGLLVIFLSTSLSFIYTGCGSKFGATANPAGGIDGGAGDEANFGEGAFPDGGDILKKDKKKDDEVVPVGCLDNDADGDCNDADNCVDVANADQNNNDGDAAGDACDDNDDNDAFTDVEEAELGTDPFVVTADFDEDGIPDFVDNCSFTSNPDQADTDGDGIGDVCDEAEGGDPNDTDNDGIPNATDNCPDVANPGQTNSDADAFGDACDTCPANAAIHEEGLACEADAEAPAPNWCVAHAEDDMCNIYNLICLSDPASDEMCPCIIGEVEDNQDPASCLEEEEEEDSDEAGFRCADLEGASRFNCEHPGLEERLHSMEEYIRIMALLNGGGRRPIPGPNPCLSCPPDDYMNSRINPRDFVTDPAEDFVANPVRDRVSNPVVDYVGHNISEVESHVANPTGDPASNPRTRTTKEAGLGTRGTTYQVSTQVTSNGVTQRTEQIQEGTQRAVQARTRGAERRAMQR